MNPIRVNLGPRSYDIDIVSNDAHVGEFARQRAPKSRLAIVVADANTIILASAAATALANSSFTIEMAVVPAGEASKCLAQAEKLYDQFAGLNADRHTLVVAVGGGVVGDLAGFVAATWNRGLPLLMVPTTLLAMVDSSVGGKVGINHARGKNLIGAFHQPVGVWIDTQLLATLPEREYFSGLAEVVKYGVILDAEFFGWIDDHADAILARDPSAVRHMVARSCRLKADVVEKDEREETGLRMILNYGHTFAHAFETIGGYGTWLHGEAVAAGMISASRLAERLNLIPAEVTQRQMRLFERFHLPTGPKNWPVDELIAVMHRDKKAQGGKLRFVLPKRIGEVVILDAMDEKMVADVLRIA